MVSGPFVYTWARSVVPAPPAMAVVSFLVFMACSRWFLAISPNPERVRVCLLLQQCALWRLWRSWRLRCWFLALSPIPGRVRRCSFMALRFGFWPSHQCLGAIGCACSASNDRCGFSGVYGVFVVLSGPVANSWARSAVLVYGVTLRFLAFPPMHGCDRLRLFRQQ